MRLMAILAMPVMVLCISASCPHEAPLRRGDQAAFVTEVSNLVPAAETAAKAGEPLSEATLLKKLGPPDIRVPIAALAKRTQTDTDIEAFIDMIYSFVRDRSVSNPSRHTIPPWREDAQYMESILIIYDESLRYRYVPAGVYEGGPVGAAFLLRQGAVESATGISQANLTSISPTCEWTQLLKPEDFVTPPKYPNFRGRRVPADKE